MTRNGNKKEVRSEGTHVILPQPGIEFGQVALGFVNYTRTRAHHPVGPGRRCQPPYTATNLYVAAPQFSHIRGQTGSGKRYEPRSKREPKDIVPRVITCPGRARQWDPTNTRAVRSRWLRFSCVRERRGQRASEGPCPVGPQG